MHPWPPRVRPGFPLQIGDRGYYKRIAGKNRWICSKEKTPEEALVIYHNKAAALVAGAEPLPQSKVDTGEIVTMHYVLNQWIVDREQDHLTGKLSATAFVQYRRSAVRMDPIIGHLPTTDITPEHPRMIFSKLLEQFSADAARRAIAHLRQACRHAEDMGWCGTIRLGRQVAKLVSRPQQAMPWVLYTPEQIRQILAELDRLLRESDGRARPSWTQFRAMTLLALNGGYGAKELADLPRAVIDLGGSRIDYRRGKTGADHIVPLWPETVDALRDAIALRLNDHLVFRTRQGNPWVISESKTVDGKLKKRTTDHVNERWKDLVEPLGLRIEGQGFYKLKHLHCSIADRAGDPHATFALAGHELPGSKGHYVRIDEDRLRRVVQFVHDHLFSSELPDSQDESAAPRRRSGRSGSAAHRPRERAGENRASRKGSRRPAPSRASSSGTSPASARPLEVKSVRRRA